MKNTFKTLSLFGLIMAVSACDYDQRDHFRPSMYDPSRLTQRSIVVEENRYVDKQTVDNVDYDYLMSLSQDYERFGSSPLYMVVAYNPDVKNAKRDATNKVNMTKGRLAKIGIRDAVVKALPVAESEGQAVIAYDRVTARGPQDCGEMPGMDAESGAYSRYGMGCTLKQAMASQVYYPEDLKGKSGMDAWDADRSAASVNRDVRSGEISEFVPSYVLSALASNTTN